jgi:hypothetical protein
MLLQEVRLYGGETVRREKPNVALYYLNSSLEIELQDPRSEQLNIAGTYLNLTAILTKLGKHKEAVSNAKAAILILRKLIDKREELLKQAHAKGQELLVNDKQAFSTRVDVGGDGQHLDPEADALKT